MIKTTVFLYPGLNGFIKEKDRFKYIEIPEVKERLQQVQDIFKTHNDIFNYREFLSQPVEVIYSVENISKTATMIVATQTGISDYLINRGVHPDMTLGCSLGDLARGVMSGVCRFDDTIHGYIRFSEQLSGVEKIGANVGVSKLDGLAFDKSELDYIESFDLDISVMTPKFLNIGGRNESLTELQKYAQGQSWRFVKILDYPAHSKHIKPFVEAAYLEVKDVEVQRPKYRTFSSISCRELLDPEDLKSEVIMNMTHPLRWGEAVQIIAQQNENVEFINVGPCQSLYKMYGDLGLSNKLSEIEI